jgi:hypothetical protein
MIPFAITVIISAFIVLGIIERQSNPARLLPIIIFSLFAFCWLFFGEFRSKLTRLTIKDDFIIIKKFAGLFTGNKYQFEEVDGFKKSIMPSRGGIEYLHIISQGKKVGTMSEFHHKNYWEVKQSLEAKIQDLGFEK